MSGARDDQHPSDTPSSKTLQERAGGTETVYGSPAFTSDYRSRSADSTYNEVDDHLSVIDLQDFYAAWNHIGDEDMITVDYTLGDEEEFICRYHVPEEYARIPLTLDNLMERYGGDQEPDFETVQLPDYDFNDDAGELMIVRPEDGKTAVMGSDYTGEAKKSFLRNFMYAVKQEGGLGLHAGTKRVGIETDGDLEEVGQIYFGLSGTGKSTLTSHGFWLDGEEYAEMVQDDVCALMPDGSVIGTESNGIYAKTNGLTTAQEKLYDAVTAKPTILENVAVDEDGYVDFADTELTANGRAAVRREELDSAADDIDLSSADQLYFITRNELMPPVARLTPEQAAATFMLGESIETSAGDPERAGEAVRVPGFNPFIIGSPGEEGNQLLDLITDEHGHEQAESYVINTGHVAGNDISVTDTVAVLRETTRGDVEWVYDDQIGMDVPLELDGIETDAYHPPEQVDEFEEQWQALTRERRQYLSQFDDLDDSIRDALQ